MAKRDNIRDSRIDGSTDFSTDNKIDRTTGYSADSSTESPVGGFRNSVFPSLDDEYVIEEDDPEGEPSEEPEEDPDCEQDEQDGKKKGKKGGKTSPFKLLLEMMVNPVEGWKKIRRAKYTPEEVANRCLYPLAAVAAASCFADLFYSATSTVSECLVRAISVFVAFFFGNFLILIIQKALYPKLHKELPDSKFGKEFAAYNLATLCIFSTLYQLLPMIGPVLAFLPIWTIFLVIKGSRFFRFPEEKENLMIAINCMAIVGVPIAIFSLFDAIL